MERVKKEYQEKIRLGLRRLPYESVRKALDDFEEIFESQKLVSKSSRDLRKRIGSPREFCHVYKLQAGIPSAPSSEGWKKFVLTLFGGGVFLILAVSVGVFILIKQFTPLFEEDRILGKVSLLGGKYSITQDGDHLVFKSGSREESSKISGQSDYKELILSFNQGRLVIFDSKGKSSHWECRVNSSDQYQYDKKEVNLLFSEGSDCKVHVQEGSKLKIIGQQGEIDLESVKANLEVRLDQGDIHIDSSGVKGLVKVEADVSMGMKEILEAPSEAQYHYQIQLDQGRVTQSE